MATNLLTYRNQAGVSQSAAADRLSMSQPAYSHLESAAKPLTVEQSLNLAGLFDVSSKRLFTDHALWSLDRLIESGAHTDRIRRFLGPVMISLLCWPDNDRLDPTDPDSGLYARLVLLRNQADFSGGGQS